jgi:lipoprotein NlpI
MLMTLRLAVIAFFAMAPQLSAQSPDELVKEAAAAWGRKDQEKALALLEQALKKSPDNEAALYLRGSLHDARADKLTGQAVLDAYAAGEKDFNRLLELNPKEADAYHSRGCLRFKLGRVDASLADFDKFLELRPERRASHWQRGISCYYAGKYAEGIKQFEGYQDFDANDVENAVWRFLCQAKKDGLAKAQQAMLKVGPDRRVPMLEIYDLYRGTRKIDEVLAAANADASSAAAKNRQLFYAHLYLGIWHDLLGDRPRALEHLGKATDEYRIPHYMWDVARVHRDRLKETK